MRFQGFDLNLLVALDALLIERQVSRAAERLRLSQPATSSALHRLRAHFGDPLLVQVGRRFVLTPLAEDMQPRVRAVLSELEPLLGQSRPATAPGRTFRIMASDYVGTILLPTVARRIAEAALPAALSIVPIGPAYEEALQLGEIDLLIAPEQLRISDEPARDLFSDSYSCLAWTGNAGVQPILSREAFEAATHLVVLLGRGYRLNTDAVQLARANLARNSCVSVPHFLMVPAYLIGTMMLATIHTRLAHYLAASNPVVVLATPAALPQITEIMQWNHHRDADRLHTRLRDIVVQAAAEL